MESGHWLFAVQRPLVISWPSHGALVGFKRICTDFCVFGDSRCIQNITYTCAGALAEEQDHIPAHFASQLYVFYDESDV